jgi:hypothetical protein
MEAELRRQGLPLYSLETFTPLAEFDVLGFSGHGADSEGCGAVV